MNDADLAIEKSNKLSLLLQLLDISDKSVSLLVCHYDPVGQELQSLVGLQLHAGQVDHQHQVEKCKTL